MSRVLLHSSNAAGHVINCNHAWLEALGYTRQEALGLHRNDYCTTESMKRLETFLVPTATAQGEVNDVPFEFVTKSGIKLPVLCTAMMFYAPDGEVSHSVVASEPIDRDLHQQLLELRAQLDAARKVVAENVRAASDLLAQLTT